MWIAWRCVVLAVDTATRSGWAVRAGDRLVASGEAHTPDAGELDAIVHEAMGYSGPVVLVLERAWGNRTNTLLALGAARERWVAAWRRAGLPERRVVPVYPATWRAKVLGGGAHAMARDDVRPLELASATGEVIGLRGVSRGTVPPPELGPDEAAAILISRWACRAPQVGAVLSKRVRELSRPLPPVSQTRAK